MAHCWRSGHFVNRFILVLVVLSALIISGDSSDFCTELDQTAGYTDLRELLQTMCQQNLDQDEQVLGTHSVEFMKDLSVFSATWRENETSAREYADRIDGRYRTIMSMNMNASGVPLMVDSLYTREINILESELDVQADHIARINSFIALLEETERALTTRRQRLNTEAGYVSGIEQNLSLTYEQRALESQDLRSNLGRLAAEYDQDRTRFIAGLLPFLLFGFVSGAVLGFLLGRKWKREKRYWHAYSSSAKVGSPLKPAALLTGAMVAALVLYLYLSGMWDAIAAG